jgi:hypothetical protein
VSILCAAEAVTVDPLAVAALEDGSFRTGSPADPPEGGQAVTDDDFRELEPHISDHPFQPGTWPDACGHVDERGWTCGYTRAEHTHIRGEESTPP